VARPVTKPDGIKQERKKERTNERKNRKRETGRGGEGRGEREKCNGRTALAHARIFRASAESRAARARPRLCGLSRTVEYKCEIGSSSRPTQCDEREKAESIKRRCMTQTHAHTETGTGSTAVAAEEECGRLWMYGGESLS